MPTVRMCPDCRRSRQKCEPVERVWIVGRQDKCERWSRSGRDCGPHEFTPQHGKRISSAQQSQAGRADTSLIPAEAAPVPVLAQTSTRIVEEIREDKIELERRLRYLEVQLEVTQRIQNAVNTQPVENENLNAEMFRLRNANINVLCLLPGLAEAYADRVARHGEKEIAASAYTRISSAYQAYETLVPHKPWHELRNLLLKMSKIYKSMGDFRRAAQYTWEALEARECPNADLSDLELLRVLGHTLLPRICKKFSDRMQDTGSELAFPLLHAMMESSYASSVIGNPFRRGHFPEEYFDSNEPIVGGIGAIISLLDVFPVSELETRDLYGRSPLNLAASLGMEGLGRAILFKANQSAGLSRQILVNSRAATGQTVLGAAICSNSSASFVKYLIENEAEIDPDPLMPIFTPLQTTVVLSLLDFVKLLLEHGARLDRTYIGWQNPVELANSLALGKPEDSVECQIAQYLNAAATREGSNSVGDSIWRPP